MSRIKRVPNFLILAHRLSLNTPYCTSTIFEDINLLTERSILIYGPDGLKYHYPIDADPEADYEFEDPVAVFFSRLDRYFKNISCLGLQCASEISGGIDSAVIAYFSSRYNCNELSLGILLDGELGIEQKTRREHVIKALELMDYTVHIRNHNPIISLLERRCALYRDEFYLKGFEQIWSKAKDQDCDSIINGQGGDELFFVQRKLTRSIANNERIYPSFLSSQAKLAASIDSPLWAPSGLMASSVYNGFGVQSREMVKMGLWPLQPFTMPNIVSPCKQIKLSKAINKQILRDILKQAIGIDVFPIGYQKENFTAVMMNYIIKNQSSILGECRDLALSRIGLIDNKLLSVFLKNFFETRSVEKLNQLVFLLSIEGVVREYASV